MADELAFLTIADAAPRIERKELSPVELTTALLRRTEALACSSSAVSGSDLRTQQTLVVEQSSGSHRQIAVPTPAF
jgi:Asp-tRNA(Asn)/Glu-tRNA(Gln) amidotransferase A subunit family amidase